MEKNNQVNYHNYTLEGMALDLKNALEQAHQTINQYPFKENLLAELNFIRSEVQKNKSSLSMLRTDLQLPKQVLIADMNSISEIAREIINPRGFPFIKINISTKSEDTDNGDGIGIEQPISLEQEIKKSLNKIGIQQKLILLQVYGELEDKKTDKVRLSLSKWSGGKSISGSERATWSKALRKLIHRGLIIKSFNDRNLLSKPNTGNSISYISLTPLGYRAAKWLIKNDLL
ncbi:hypothetical protein [Gloeocapsa sp. PCC 73106]|uniref:hypothetical protein n=1 Tax=Gloeocapsa sp. PCC 73106 TaxID=102232 RepID=UPI0002ACA530|nr:hypothetical protein [Gloeocapsa sp. PCC 73106]ELR97395.1 hypothetical protein GLO73106DRAFT_00012050 [Gloeocapsa sp. PCC 73106]